MDNLTERLDALRQKLQESDFLQRKGLSNEVGIWIFQYNAADEMAVRHFTRQIAADQELHCRIIERAEASKEPRQILRVLRQLLHLRKQINAGVLHDVIQDLLPPSGLENRRQIIIHQPQSRRARARAAIF